MSDPRKTRLESERRDLYALAQSARPWFEILGSQGAPPTSYRLALRVPSVERVSGTDSVVLRESHSFAVRLPPDYPFAAPLVQFDTPILHLHVYESGKLCLGKGGGLDESLADLVCRLARVLQYDLAFIDERSVANGSARTSYLALKRAGRLPLGTIDLRNAQPPARPALVWKER